MEVHSQPSRLLTAVALLLLLSARARADETAGGPDIAPLFQRGRIELSAGGGYGNDGRRDYLILALGGGYYLADGLSAGLMSEAWLGNSPTIGDVSPQLRYVFLDAPWNLKPYAGLFYRRTFYSRRFPALNSIGGRAGLVLPLTSQAYLTGGLAYEHYFDCSTRDDADCDSAYPELGLEFSF